MAAIASLLLSALAASVSASVENPSIQQTPPMGFNNWARFECNLNETLFTTTADAMASKGLLAAGYSHINMDDCWLNTERNSQGKLAWNTTLFPHGLPWLADYLHTRGFKFGIYENAGNMTCGWYPGSQDHELVDAQTFESWGIDYLKLDACHMDLQHGRTIYEEFKYRYQLWHQILTSQLNKTMIFSQSAPAYFSPNFHTDLNNTDWYRTMDYIRSNGELARHSDDVKVYGDNPTNKFEPGGHWESIMNNYGMEVRLSRYQSCGFFNDPDFLIVDWPDLSLDEKKSHFSLWSSFSAPLILSAYIPDLTNEEVTYLTNKEIIAVDQDSLCEQATLVSQDGYTDVLTKNLANGDRLLTVLNRGNDTNTTTIATERLGLPIGEYIAIDLWTNKTNTFRRSIDVKLRTHETAIFRVSSPKATNLTITPTGVIFNTFSLNCLASRSSTHSSVVFRTCDAADGQVWTVSNGLVSPLSDTARCLATSGSSVSLEKCDKTDKTQQWSYGVSGTLVNNAKGLCLQEGSDGAVARKCADETDSQVFALPGGVPLVNDVADA